MAKNDENMELTDEEKQLKEKVSWYTMPDRFVKKPQGKNYAKLFVLIFVIIFIIGIGTAGIFYGVSKLGQVKVAEVTNKEDKKTTDTSKEETKEDIKEEDEISDIQEQGKFVREYTSTKDSDNDGLTDKEEILFKTFMSRIDSDGDGHSDKEEILNLYDPMGVAPSYLVDSNNIEVYENEKYNYSVYYPKLWILDTTDVSGKRVEFKSETAESVIISIAENNDNLGIIDWYLKQNSDMGRGDIKLITTKAGLRGIKSKDGLNYYLVMPKYEYIGAEGQAESYIYILTYDTAGKTELSYLTVFSMMVNSFNLGGVLMPE
jgi:hypothetical protein